MCNAHVGHNVVIGSNVTLVNGAGIGGFCVLEDRSYVSAFSPIHQFCRIGTLAFIATVSKPDKDVPPFFLVSGNPAEVCGINRVGIDRAGIPESDKEIIKKLYKIFSRSGLNTTQALQKIKTELPQNEHVKHFIEFVESSKRGVYK
jgi:UDP-N-acetylglucosamine acyltransferase